ncbi:hypothetical protein PVAND_016651 [Polypedilum vanderplanki]|uniref:F-box domain-containing protein n=1 Tax=Polypedilum vanderplanki TaxID=319348 RepID=A0A9J6BFR7_POLVA|nr:hypothetical protein PVAND_016651 [Polypedilum vanderplanki]
MENSSANFLSLPNEILLKIFDQIEDDKNLLLTCRRFYEIIKMKNEKNSILSIDYRFMINPKFDFNNFIKISSTISLRIDDRFIKLINKEEKIEYFLNEHGHKITNLFMDNSIKNFLTKFQPLLPNLEKLRAESKIYFKDTKIEEFSIPLKKLTLLSLKNIQEFKIFDIQELEIYNNTTQEIFNEIKDFKNIKKLSISNLNDDIDLSEVLNEMNLESFNFQNRRQKTFINSLIKQKNLKELSLYNMTNQNFVLICENLNFLEKLSIDFVGEYLDIEKLENLKFLRKFEIKYLLSGFQFDYLTNLKVENLEILYLPINFNHSKEDFENLSKNYFGQNCINNEILEFLFSKFPKLKIVKNLKITEEILETFLKYQRNFEEFSVNVNILENPNEILQDCSIKFYEEEIYPYEVYNQFKKEKDKTIEFSIQNFSQWQKLQMLLDSPRKIKHLKIFCMKNRNSYDEFTSNILKIIGSDVKILTINDNFTSSQLEIFIKNLPNCEEIIFDTVENLRYYFNPFDVFDMKDTKITSVCFILDENFEFNWISLKDFLKNLNFPKNSLKKFKLIIKNTCENSMNTKYLKGFKKFLQNQDNLTKKSENWIQENHETHILYKAEEK